MAGNEHDSKDTPETKSKKENVSGCSTSGRNGAFPSVLETGTSNPVNVDSLNHVCKALNFGDSIDSNETFMIRLCGESERQRQREKWNFDFENEVPLEGDWEWERVQTENPKVKEVVSSLKKNNENRNV